MRRNLGPTMMLVLYVGGWRLNSSMNISLVLLKPSFHSFANREVFIDSNHAGLRWTWQAESFGYVSSSIFI